MAARSAVHSEGLCSSARQARLTGEIKTNQKQVSTGVVALTGQLLKGQPGNVEALLMRGQVRHFLIFFAHGTCFRHLLLCSFQLVRAVQGALPFRLDSWLFMLKAQTGLMLCLASVSEAFTPKGMSEMALHASLA